MYQIKAPKPIDYNEYKAHTPKNRTLYGLPEEVKFCSQCTYSNQKPNSEREFKHHVHTKKPTVAFDEEGVCSACKVALQKKKIDWKEREAELTELCNRYRRNDGHYDCLVPGSGGKDSFFAAYTLKYQYKMNPLTITWAPHIYTPWGWDNFQAWNQAGFDNFLFTPNGRVHRLLTRVALEKIFHPFQPFILGQMYFPPKIAMQLNIPLIFYGENPSEYGNNATENNSAAKDPRYITAEKNLHELYIAGVKVWDLKQHFGLGEVDLEPYLPPNPEQLQKSHLNIQYLGYYLPWHPQECYYFAVENGGFKAAPERTVGTYSKYSSIDDKIDDFHYYTTYVKFGIGRATYDSAQEVRNGDITREEAIALVSRFDGEYPKRFEQEIFDYLSINRREFPVAFDQFEVPRFDKSYFDLLTNQFRSPHLWHFEEGQWKLRHTIYHKKSALQETTG